MIYRCDDPVALALTAPGSEFELVDTPRGRRFARHPLTLSGVIAHARRYGPRPLVEAMGVTYSYDEIFARAGRIAHLLAGELGVRPGDYVGLAMTAGADWMATYIAVVAAGAAAVLVNTRGAPEEMVHALGRVDARIVFADRARAAALQSEAADQGWRMVLSGAADLVRPDRDVDLGAVVAADDYPLEIVERSANDPAMVLFTSGTTGRPKAVRIDHGSVAHVIVIAGLVGAMQDTVYAREYGRAVPPERRSAASATVIAAPVFHFSGVMPFLRGLYFGAPLFVMARWDVDAAFDLMERQPLTRLAFVPTMLSDMLASSRAGPQNLGGVMVLSNGAASLDTNLVERLGKAMPGAMLANTYGQTESSAWISTICGAEYVAYPTSIGRVLPSVELRIVRDDGSDAAPREHGEICVCGPIVMREYVGEPEATAETIRDGWLRTGDIGWADEEGRLYIADRKRNMVISGGENIYCAEVERVLGDHPAVAEVIAYGRPDERLGERIAATIVPRPGATVDLDALKAYARTRLAGYKIPRDLRVRTTPLPRTPTFKVDRARFIRELDAEA